MSDDNRHAPLNYYMLVVVCSFNYVVCMKAVVKKATCILHSAPLTRRFFHFLLHFLFLS